MGCLCGLMWDLFQRPCVSKMQMTIGLFDQYVGKNKYTYMSEGLSLFFSKPFSILFYFFQISYAKKKKKTNQKGNNRSHSVLIPKRASLSLCDSCKIRSESMGQFLCPTCQNHHVKHQNSSLCLILCCFHACGENMK